jgi:hypothetical protein
MTGKVEGRPLDREGGKHVLQQPPENFVQAYWAGPAAGGGLGARLFRP